MFRAHKDSFYKNPLEAAVAWAVAAIAPWGAMVWATVEGGRGQKPYTVAVSQGHGGYYQQAISIKDALKGDVPVNVIEEKYGSPKCLQDIQDGTADFAFTTDGFLSDDGISAIARLGPTPMCVFIKKELKYDTLGTALSSPDNPSIYCGNFDLDPSQPNVLRSIVNEFLLPSYKTDASQIRRWKSDLSYGQAVEAELKNLHGNVGQKKDTADVLLIMGSASSPPVQKLVDSHLFRIIPITRSKALEQRHAGVKAAFIEQGAFDGWPNVPDVPIETFTTQGILAAGARADTNRIYRFLKAFSESPKLQSMFPDFNNAFKANPELQFSQPVHDAARRFYRHDPLDPLLPSWVWGAITTWTITVGGWFLLSLRMRRLDPHLKTINRCLQVLSDTSKSINERDAAIATIRDARAKVLDLYAKGKLRKEDYELIATYSSQAGANV
jgi:TRAP-type uncharacterized transport system substrate-binding protein